MSGPPPDQQLREVEAALQSDPRHVDLLYLRATLLADLGRDTDAREGFLAVLAHHPTHFGALNDLGTMLHKSDFRAAARTAYAEAVKHHPGQVIGRINLGNALLTDGQWTAAKHHLTAAINLSPDHPDAHQGLATLFQELGDWDAAEHHRQQSYRSRAISLQAYRGRGTPVRVLLLVSAIGGNIPTRFLLDDQTFETSVLVAEAQASQEVLPVHDLVFNAVGDADLCMAALDSVDAVLARTQAPVVNRPGPVRLTGREANARRLGTLAHVRTPHVEKISRMDLLQTPPDVQYPILVRSLGFHTGRHFARVDAAQDLPRSISDLPGSDLLLIEYLDARDSLGRWRKYRVMLVGGEVFPLHLAVSTEWKVHYFTADMADRPDHRAEEARFLHNMVGVLGVRAINALKRLSKTLGLDYAGVDFAIGQSGELLVFEANATMVVNPPPAEPIWDYRRAAVERIFAAVRGLLTRRSGDQVVRPG